MIIVLDLGEVQLKQLKPNSNRYLWGLIIKLEFVKLRCTDTWHGLLV